MMNLPFVNISSISHPIAENILPPLLHFASAVYYNSQYWEDIDRVRADLEHESHYNDYILHKLSFNDVHNLFTIHGRYHLSFMSIITIETIMTDIYAAFFSCIALLLYINGHFFYNRFLEISLIQIMAIVFLELILLLCYVYQLLQILL